MKRLFPFFVLMLLWASCEEECPPTFYSTNGYTSAVDIAKFLGTWRYAYSVLYCDSYPFGDPQVVDTIYPGDTVTWNFEPVSSQTIIIHEQVTVIKNDTTLIYCIEEWRQESFDPRDNGTRDWLRIYGSGPFFYSLQSVDVLEIDTLQGWPDIELQTPCGPATSRTTDYYVRVK